MSKRIGIVDMSPDEIEAVRKAVEGTITRMEYIRQRKIRRVVERRYQRDLTVALRGWASQFEKFAKRTNLHEKLYEKASRYFPLGRDIEFSKAISPSEQAIDWVRVVDCLEWEYSLLEDRWIYTEVLPEEFILKQAERVSPGQLDEVSRLLAGFAFDTDEFAGTMLGYDLEIYEAQGQRMLRELERRRKFVLRDRKIVKAIGDRINLITGNFSDRSFERLKLQLAKSYFIEGKNPILRGVTPTGRKVSSVADDIIHFFDSNIKRARTIARTETMCMESQATFEFGQKVGVRRHGWLTAGDDKVRDEHVINHGIEVNMGEPFPSGQVRVGEGDAGLVINCRCANYSVLTGDEVPWFGG